MGCVSSKQATSHSPDLHHHHNRHRHHEHSSVIGVDNGGSLLHGLGHLEKIKEEPEKEGHDSVHSKFSGNLRGSKKGNNEKKANSEKKASFSIRFGRLSEGEHLAAGWPAWLTAVAGEAIDGWMPLKSNMFQKLEKIGQGTYSSVYRARDIESGKMVALKKVRFDNFQPDSVRFMAREIAILRKLDHPNVMKLEGIITSRLSCSIYLVFEYMEHDLSGLLSCPDIKFSDSQVKCYMQQLLRGLDHCHSRGIMHRDIKVSNILVNNEGILKIADFGLGNILNSRHKQPLTSRVVTLWYRPPELLLGSTSYGVNVDLWSVGCVFAELFFGRPVLKGRTEVEQLHKIFKLCGSPPDDYWKKSKLPLATMFKPKHPYESTLRDRCKELPKTAVALIETLLSVDPYKRGTASSALGSEYFYTKPYACDPSSLPKYPPNKEIDAKYREEARRKRATSAAQASETSRNSRKARKALQDPSNFSKVVPAEEVEADVHGSHRHHGASGHISKGRRATVSRVSMKPVYDTISEVSQMTDESHAESTTLSVPVQMPEPTGFAWAKKGKHDPTATRLYPPTNSRSQKLCALDSFDSSMHDNDDFLSRSHTFKHSIHTQHGHHKQPDSFDSTDQELAMDYNGQQGRIGFSGPLICQPHRFDSKQNSQTLKGGQRTRFYRDF